MTSAALWARRGSGFHRTRSNGQSRKGPGKPGQRPTRSPLEAAPAACLSDDGEQQTGHARHRAGLRTWWRELLGGLRQWCSPETLGWGLGSAACHASAWTQRHGHWLCDRGQLALCPPSPAAVVTAHGVPGGAQGQVLPTGTTMFSRRSELSPEARSPSNSWCVDVCAALRPANRTGPVTSQTCQLLTGEGTTKQNYAHTIQSHNGGQVPVRGHRVVRV